MEHEYTVRVGEPEDVDGMMELALSACEENGFVEPNPMRLLGELWPALNRQRGIVGIIGEIGEKPEGAILLRIGQIWYSDAEILEERTVFLRPEFRAAKGGRAKRL
mgnify:FL=1